MLHHARPGFALLDLGAAIAVGAVLASLLALGLADTRRTARLDEDLAGLQRFAAGTSAYAADYEGRLWGFSWKEDQEYQMLGLDGEYTTVIPQSAIEAGALQCVHLIRLLGDRIGDDGMPTVNGFLAQVYYSHLPLMQYLGEDPLARWTASAADEVRADWKDDPINKFDQGLWLPLQPDPTPNNRRWPYGSGFEVAVGTWDYYQSAVADEFNARRVYQASQHNQWIIPGNALFRQRRLDDVYHPAGKAHVYDTHQRHFGPRRPFLGLEEARIPVLTFDGSALVRRSADANPGWRPSSPTFPCMTFWYNPAAWEPPTTNGQFQEFVKGNYRWTRGGLRGIDFGALPLDTGQASPGECDL